jgi:hypothetical protein
MTGEPATPVAVAEVVVDDGVELEPHAATHAATTAATAMNRMEVNLCVLVFKTLLPHSGWRPALTAGPDEGLADGMGSPAFGSPIRGCSTPRVKQYQLRIVDRSLDIPPCHRQSSLESVQRQLTARNTRSATEC